LAGYIPKWFTRPQTVTHPSTNRVWRSATTLIEANALPLSQTANKLAGMYSHLLVLLTDWSQRVTTKPNRQGHELVNFGV